MSEARQDDPLWSRLLSERGLGTMLAVVLTGAFLWFGVRFVSDAQAFQAQMIAEGARTNEKLEQLQIAHAQQAIQIDRIEALFTEQERAMIEGIDVSNHQQSVAWDTVVGSGVKFAIVKASEGIDFTDRYFSRNWSEMKRLALPRGAYHFARPSASGAIAEADFFLNVVEPEGIEPGDILALDMEDDRYPVGSSLSAWSLAWMDYVEKRTGCRPIFYTYPSYIRERGLNDPRLANYPLWYASYQQSFPPVPRPWSRISIWQYTSEQIVPGAGVRIDCNQFNGDDIADLLALGMPGLSAATEDDGPYATPDEAYNAYCAAWDDEVVWAGQIAGRGHWFGREPQPVARTAGNRLLAYDGAVAQDATGQALDDWQSLVADQLTIW